MLNTTCLTRLQVAMVLALTTSLASCSLFGDTGVEDDLSENRQRWERAGASNYEFAYSVYCFCGLTRDYHQPFLVVVRADTVSAVLDLETREPVVHVVTGEQISPSYFAFLLTIDGLFEVIEQAIERDYHKREVVYDRVLGYPVSIDIEYEPGSGLTDGFIFYRAEGLRIENE